MLDPLASEAAPAGAGAAPIRARGPARLPRRAAAWLALGLAVAGGTMLQVAPPDDPDLWWLLKTGERIVATRSVPTTDPFSWTAPGAPWVNHAWGFALALYGLERLAGPTGLLALTVAFALATFGVMAWTLRREGVPVGWAAAVVALAAVATRGSWAPRPQVATYLALAVLWALLADYRAGRGDRLLWLVPLTALWANLHGGVVAGLGILGLVTLGTAVERLFPGGERSVARPGRLGAVWLGCLAASLLNPFHLRALAFALEVAGDRAAKDFILEWSSPVFHRPELRPFEVWLLGVLLLLPAARRPVRLAELGLVLALVHLALDAIRNTPLFVILLAPLAGRLATDAGLRLRQAPGTTGAGWPWRAAALGTLAALGLAGWGRDLPPVLGPLLRPGGRATLVFPAAAADFLVTQPWPDRLYNDYGWGGYLIWRLYPRYRVFLDGRIAVYPPDVRRDFLTINNAEPGWREVLDRWEVAVVLVRRGTALATLLREAAGWQLAYQDDRAVVFRREEGVPAEAARDPAPPGGQG